MTNFFRFKFLPIFLWIVFTAFGMICACRCEAAAQKLYQGEGKRDPFVQLVGIGARQSAGGLLGVETIDEIQIEGIMLDQSPKASIAVVNGLVLKENEEVGNVKVLKIDAAGVLFSVNGIEGYKTLYQEARQS